MSFKLNKKQQEAVLKSLEWYYCKSYDKPLFIISGVAGSGKSTTIDSIIKTLGILKNNILFTTLIGKAASVLRLKGHLANTIHKTFYNAKVYKNNVYFTKKHSIPSFIKLIIIDEFGMVDNNIVEDILSFGIPVIALGDFCQLPPVFGKNDFLTEELSDIFLDEVMRTDDKSGILTLAMNARKKETIIPGIYGDSRVLLNKDDIDILTNYDKIITWTNKTRKYLNRLIRNMLNIDEIYPTKNEKVVFLHNRYDKMISYLGIDINIMNGIECIVLEDYKIINEDQIQLKLRPIFFDDNCEYFDVLCNRKIFDSYDENNIDNKTLMMIDKEKNLNSVFCDFSYAITGTASQGSEWGKILVIDEMPKYRPEYWKWLYTAITRAKSKIDLLLDQQY